MPNQPRIVPKKPTLRDIAKKKTKKAVVSIAETPAAESSGRTALATTVEAATGDASGAMVVVPPKAIHISGEPEKSERSESQRPLKRKNSAKDKGKGIAPAAKKTRRDLATSPGARLEKVYSDPLAAAALMAQIASPGDNLLIPENLLRSELYKEFAVRQAKSIAHCNRMIIAYDHEARSRQAFIEEARQKEVAEKTRVAGEMDKLTAELRAYKKSSNQTSLHLQRVVLEKRMCEEKAAKLAEEVARHEALEEVRVRDLEDAVAAARRTAVAEVQSQMGRAFELFNRMMKGPVKRARYLAQAEANLQLIDDLENPDEPCDLATERASLIENMERLSDAHTVFDGMAEELKKILGKNYLAPIKVGDLVASPRVETIAKSVGINAASGSNDGSMGLHLRGLSEESSDSESEGIANPELTPVREPNVTEAASSRAADVAADQAAPPCELAHSEQEPKIGEAASSAKAAPAEEVAEERTVEEGELVAEDQVVKDGEPVA